MRILVWVLPGTWPACVDAAAALAPGADPEFEVLHVIDPEPAEIAAGAFDGLMGRGHRHDPGLRVRSLAREGAERLLQHAAARLGRPATLTVREGSPDRVVIEAAQGMDCIVVGRDADHTRLGPKSLGRHTRFVVDHAPCHVILVWPDTPPGLDSLPAPPHGPPHGGPHHPPPHHQPPRGPKHPPPPR